MPLQRESQSNLPSLIDAHTERLRVLQLMEARQGNDTPPHIITEIEQIEKELAQLKQAAASPVSDDLVEMMGPVGRYQLTVSHIMRLDSNDWRLEQKVEKLSRRVEKLHDKFDEVLIALGVKAAPQPRRRKPIV